ncbi:MAG: L-ribulose-5-phosphate 3-epimerase [Planctomycetota bacterium]|jgi:L-ribulose-5-phosphate 3-epimerase
MSHPTRRAVLSGSAALAAGTLLPRPALAARSSSAAAGPILFSVKYPMVNAPESMAERFAMLKRVGFDGVEMESPNGYDEAEVLRISREVGLPVHGAVNSMHWGTRLSDPDAAVRAKAVAGLIEALRESHAMGGHSVLLVPGAVKGLNEDAAMVEERSIAGIRAALPEAARLGVRILIENVWNRFLYDHDGGADQSAEALREYLEKIDSPWVGSYFDIGNHRKYGRPEEWIRTLGRFVVKLDVKDWGVEGGWAKIGEGDVDWPKVREALGEIGFTGWATAEVGGGGEERMLDIHARMTRALRG